MTRTHTKIRGRNWLLAISAAVLLQSLFPPGYMPASLASGWPVMLCPDGLPPGFFSAISGEHSGHHQHGDAHGDAHGDGHGGGAASDTCPVGKALDCHAMPTIAATCSEQPDTLTAGFRAVRRAPNCRVQTGFRSRAPPPARLI